MDSFWSKLLILGIVAAIGLFFIYNVYTPQKAAQEAMADSTQQSVNAVKMGVEDTATSIVMGDEVRATVLLYCVTGNDIRIVVEKLNGASYTYTTGTTSSSHGGTASSNLAITTVAENQRYYVKNDQEDASKTITFTER